MLRSNRIVSLIQYLKDHGWLDFLTILYRIACVFGLLLSTYYILRCCVSFSLAFEDFRIYRGLGFSHSLWYYLDKENINIEVYPFAFSTAELLLYIAQYHRVEYKKPSWFSVLYFSVMAGLHLLAWLYFNQLDLPRVPVQSEAEEMRLLSFRFAKLSVIQPFLYLAVYLVRIWRHRKAVM